MGKFIPANTNPNRESGGSVTNTCHLLKPGPWQWVPNGLRKVENCTRIRILPALDPETGEEFAALDPEGGIAGAPLPPARLFGQAAFVEEAAIDTGLRRYTFLTRHPQQGNISRSGVVIPDSWSPYRLFRAKLFWKLRETVIKLSQGKLVDAPLLWQNWLKRVQNNIDTLVPQQVDIILWQVLAFHVDGQDVKSGDKQPSSYHGVMYFKRSAEKLFLADVSTKERPDEPLSLANNLFGDFCSVAGGRMLHVRKVESVKKQEGSAKDAAKKSIDYNVRPLSAYPLSAAECAKRRPWSEMLVYPTIEDTIEWMIEAFDPIAVDYALRGSTYEQFLPAGVSGMAGNIEAAVDTRTLGPMPAQNADAANETPAAPRGASAGPSAPLEKFWVYLDGKTEEKNLAQVQSLVNQGKPVQVVSCAERFERWKKPAEYGIVRQFAGAPAGAPPPPFPTGNDGVVTRPAGDRAKLRLPAYDDNQGNTDPPIDVPGEDVTPAVTPGAAGDPAIRVEDQERYRQALKSALPFVKPEDK